MDIVQIEITLSKSANHVHILFCFVGTFLGEKGEKGEKGDRGSIGPEGPPGHNGTDGKCSIGLLPSNLLNERKPKN